MTVKRPLHMPTLGVCSATPLPGGIVDLDLNHDKINDFQFSATYHRSSQSCSGIKRLSSRSSAIVYQASAQDPFVLAAVTFTKC